MSDGAIVLVVFVAAAGALAWWIHAHARMATAAFERAARETGLTYAPGFPGTMEGEIRGVALSGYPSSGAGGKQGYSFCVRALPGTIRISGEGFPVSRDLRTGDDAFDRAIRIEGEEAVVLALFDAPTREIVKRHVVHYGGCLRLHDGVLTLELMDLPVKSGPVVDGILAIAETAAALLSRYPRQGRYACLAENAGHDPLLPVRVRNLEALLQGESGKWSAVFIAAAGEQDPQIRVLGAIGTGRVEVVRDVALERGAPPSVRTRAIAHLETALSSSELEALLLEMLANPMESDLLRTAVESLGRIGSARAVERLLELSGPLTATGRAASVAVEQIQQRLSGAAPGQVSLTTPGTEGSVSLSENGTAPAATPKRIPTPRRWR